MIIAPNSGARKRGEVKEDWGRIWGEKRNADYGGMTPPSQQHIAPCLRGIGHESFENDGNVRPVPSA